MIRLKDIINEILRPEKYQNAHSIIGCIYNNELLLKPLAINQIGRITHGDLAMEDYKWRATRNYLFWWQGPPKQYIEAVKEALSYVGWHPNKMVILDNVKDKELYVKYWREMHGDYSQEDLNNSKTLSKDLTGVDTFVPSKPLKYPKAEDYD